MSREHRLANQLYSLYPNAVTPEGKSILMHRADLALAAGKLTREEHSLLEKFCPEI
jgi:hypothetical protein